MSENLWFSDVFRGYRNGTLVKKTFKSKETYQSKGIIYFVRTQIVRKTNIPYPLIRTRARTYQGVRNNDFSENSAHIINK